MKLYRLSPLLIVFLVLIFAAIAPAIANAQVEDPLDEDPVFIVCGAVAFDGGNVVVDGIIILHEGAYDPNDFIEGNIVAVYGTLSDNDTSLSPDETVILNDLSECDALEEALPDDEVVFCDVADAPENDEDCEKPHPIAVILADEFDYDLATIHDWHDEEGFGYGEIARMLLIVDLSEDEEVDIDLIMELREGGAGWGQIVREVGLNPRDLAPGRVISGRYDPEGENELPAVQFVAPVSQPQNNGHANSNANNTNRGSRNGNSGGNRNGNANGRGRG
jgi:hypothetical protein